MRRGTSCIASIRIRPWAKRKVALLPLHKPGPGERRTWKALRRLLRNLEFDLNCCSCAPLAGILKHRYSDPPPKIDECPACELKASLS